MSRQANNPIAEIEKTLTAVVREDPVYKAFREKTTKLTVLGLRLPIMQKIEKAGFSFYQNSPETILKIWNEIWNESTIHEMLSLPLFYYRRYKQILDPVHWHVLKHWLERVENWEHADALCFLYSIFYERFPQLVEPTLRKLNASENPWKRRASIVSTIYYASKNRTPPKISTVLGLVKPLMKDTNPYVQKAVGWQLRECYKLWPNKTILFLEKHVLDLSAISFSYATEKVSKQEKRILKNTREQSRHDERS